jgi:hypothetical protein
MNKIGMRQPEARHLLRDVCDAQVDDVIWRHWRRSNPPDRRTDAQDHPRFRAFAVEYSKKRLLSNYLATTTIKDKALIGHFEATDAAGLHPDSFGKTSETTILPFSTSPGTAMPIAAGRCDS